MLIEDKLRELENYYSSPTYHDEYKVNELIKVVQTLLGEIIMINQKIDKLTIKDESL